MDLMPGWLTLSRRAAAAIALAACVAAPSAASAQGWWPWATDNPKPPAPINRQPPGPPPAPIPPANGGPIQQRPLPPTAGAPRGGSNICLQLEQRLVSEGQRGSQSRELLPKIEGDLRAAERTLSRPQSQLDRGDCWESFLFTKSLRRTPQCVNLSSQVETNKRKVADLDAQRQKILGSRERSYQDDIIRELARNGCGQQYIQEARKRDQQAARCPRSGAMKKHRRRARAATSSARCRLRPIARSASASATAITSR